MAERLADVSIDADGEELVFRVTPGGRLKAALGWLFTFPASSEVEKMDTPSAAQVRGAQPKPTLRAYTVAEDLAIAADYREGLSIPELVKKYGGSQPAIGRALDRENVKRRTTSESIALAHKRRKDRTAPAPPKATPAATPQPAKTQKNEAPLPGRTDKLTNEKTDAPGNNRNGPTRAEPNLGDALGRAAFMERLYLQEKLSPNTIAARLTEAGHPTSDSFVLKTLRSRRVPIRSKKEAQELSRLERGLPVHRHDVQAHKPKPKPVAIPADAARVVKSVAELTPEAVKYKTGKDALHAQTSVVAKRAQQIRNPIGAGGEQDAVDAYLAKGGKITVIESVTPAEPARARPSVGLKDGQQR